MTEQIRRLFVLYGTKDYIGEQGISQLEHALQCADAARDASESRSMQLAALCHDVGHLLLLDGHDLEDMNGLGACRHAEAGADWMASLGFGLDVTTPIRHHVDVKRYWACRDATYIQGLSPARYVVVVFKSFFCLFVHHVVSNTCVLPFQTVVQRYDCKADP